VNESRDLLIFTFLVGAATYTRATFVISIISVTCTYTNLNSVLNVIHDNLIYMTYTLNNGQNIKRSPSTEYIKSTRILLFISYKFVKRFLSKTFFITSYF